MTEIENIIAHLERQRTAIDKAIEALQGVSGAIEPVAKPAETPKGPKRSTSSEGRQRQIEGMRRYWAAKKTATKKAAPKKAAPKKAAPKQAAPKQAVKKGGLTAAGRKALSEHMKKRWAEKQAAR